MSDTRKLTEKLACLFLKNYVFIKSLMTNCNKIIKNKNLDKN
jgi:hypothetical protein